MEGKNNPSTRRKSIVVVKLDNDSEKHYDFSKDVVEWKDINVLEDDSQDACCPHSFSPDRDILHENYATILTKAQVKGRIDSEHVMKAEIKKFESFGAFERVKDNGQYAIRTRWVFSEHEDESKGYKLKARLCVRGDTEEDQEFIRAESPTAHKDTLKLALSIAANERFEIISADVKSAFLQGKTLDREVFVIPPVEAQEDGMLWLLKKGAYSLIDGSRLFYLELKKKLEKIRMKVVSGDSALFTMHKNSKLIGLVSIHVDDFFMAGNQEFKKLVIGQLMKHFQFSKIEENKFK